MNGAALSLWWGIPFTGLLLSFAIVPMLAPQFWHHHFGKVVLFWIALFLAPAFTYFGMVEITEALTHALFLEYIPFVVLLFTLFSIAGGILITGNPHGSPVTNTTLLAIGGALASVIGTTGASMVLIRPLIRANDHRRHNTHVVVFFIFIVANIGGGLTPIGDPPLFLGFLQGVDFFWPLRNLWQPTLLTLAILLGIFFMVDWFYFNHADEISPSPDITPDASLSIQGMFNIFLILIAVALVIISGIWKPKIFLEIGHTSIGLPALVRDGGLIFVALISLRYTAKAIRKENHFSWTPMLEVVKFFAGIFITIIPVLAILQAGDSGALRSLVSITTHTDGAPIAFAYYWLTGILSALLDNAPTYLVFFNMAGGNVEQLTGPLAKILAAISAGAVYFGAMTYIGNAPNFMVRAIAQERGIAMPSFFGYMKYSLIFLLPIFLLISFLFFH